MLHCHRNAFPPIFASLGRVPASLSPATNSRVCRLLKREGAQTDGCLVLIKNSGVSSLNPEPSRLTLAPLAPSEEANPACCCLLVSQALHLCLLCPVAVRPIRTIRQPCRGRHARRRALNPPTLTAMSRKPRMQSASPVTHSKTVRRHANTIPGASSRSGAYAHGRRSGEARLHRKSGTSFHSATTARGTPRTFAWIVLTAASPRCPASPTPRRFSLPTTTRS